MTTTTETRTVTLHTDNSSALPGERLAVIRWKAKKDKITGKLEENKTPALCVSVPTVTLTVEPAILRDALTAAVTDMQDTILRERIEEALEAGTAPTAILINLDWLSFTGIRDWHTANAAGSGKLSKAKLENWFDANLGDKLTVALAAAMKLPEEPTAEQLAALDAATTQHRKVICNLASPRAALNETVAKQLRKAVQLADADKTREQLLAKLDAFLRPQEVTLAIGLGE